jgi:serine protease Do
MTGTTKMEILQMKYLASLTLLASFLCFLYVGSPQEKTDLLSNAPLANPASSDHDVKASVLCGEGRGNEPFIVSDNKLKLEFLRKTQALIDAKKTVAMGELVTSLSNNENNTIALRLPRPKTEPITTEDLYSNYLKSTLMVGKPYLCKRCDKLHVGIASGFLLTDTGVFVTSHHVIAAQKNARYQTMTVMNGEGKVWPVKSVLSGNKANDFVFVQLEGKPGDFTPIPIRTNIKTGERIRTLTNPTGRYFTLSEGIVTRQFKPNRGGLWFNIDADYCKGSSGGAIFDKYGNVLGIVSTTQSIYYKVEKGIQQNLQMVFKNVTSAANFKKCVARIRRPI